MEEAKYYTPAIEEFHIGFKFEQRANDLDWKSFTIKSFENLHTLNKGLGGVLEHPITKERFNNFEVRVKWLDLDDLEEFANDNGVVDFDNICSLRLNMTNLAWSTDIDFNPKSMRFVKDDNILMNYDFTTKIGKISYEGEIGSAILFQGIIKNKSELKNLLNRLLLKR